MLKNEVGTHAGYVWNLLSKKGKLSLKDICKYIDCTDPSALLALGWLLREDKIHCEEVRGTIYVELKSSPMDIYFG